MGTKTMIKALFMGATAVALLLPASGSANAAFVLSNDNGGDGHLGTPDPGYDFLLVGSNNGVGANTTTYLETVTTAETLDIKWSYTTFDCCGSFWDPAGYYLDGTEHQLAGNPAPYTDIGATYTGSFLVNLSPGDTFGAYVFSRDSAGGVSTIEFGSAVPEASTWTMMIAGFGLVGALAMRRRYSGLAVPKAVV
jgi:hypothetical protein